nr:serine hydrolase domain-containing protein [Alteromonas sp. ASW11-130]
MLLAGCQYKQTSFEEIISKQLIENSEKHGISVQELVVIHNQNILFNGHLDLSDKHGIKNKERIFPIYSVAKLFANTLVMQLYEEGKLDLSAPASTYVPSLPYSWRNIQVIQFLNHSSGVPEYYEVIDGKVLYPTSQTETFDRLKSQPLNFEPDTETRYTQTNYLVIKRVIESVTNSTYRKLVESRIYQPLGLQNTWLGRKGVPRERIVPLNNIRNEHVNVDAFPEYAISHADAYSTIADLCTFLTGLTSGKLVSKRTLVKLWQPYALQSNKVGGFSSGWNYDRIGTWNAIGHDGGGVVRARVLFKNTLDDHYIIIYLTNDNKDGVWSRTLVDSIQQHVLPDLYIRLYSKLRYLYLSFRLAI